MKRMVGCCMLLLVCLCIGAPALAESPDAVILHNGADRFQKAVLSAQGNALMVGVEPAGYDEDDVALPTDAWALCMEGDEYRGVWLGQYGGSGDEALWDALPLADGGWLAVGEAASPDGGVMGWHEGYYDAFQNMTDGWLIRLDARGNLVWNQCVGGSHWDRFAAVCARPDGSFLAVGSTSSPDGHLAGLYTDPAGNEHSDGWIVCFSADGKVLWQKTVGHATLSDELYAIQPLTSGGYLLAGKTLVEDRAEDGWLLALDEEGNVLWEQTHGGTYGDGLSALCRTPDGGFLAVGYTESDDANLPELTRDADCSGWVLRLDADGTLLWQARVTAGDSTALTQALYDHEGFMLAGISLWPDAYVEEGWALSLDMAGEPRWSNNIYLDELFVTVLADPKGEALGQRP